jgi:hypothetical protein
MWLVRRTPPAAALALLLAAAVPTSAAALKPVPLKGQRYARSHFNCWRGKRAIVASAGYSRVVRSGNTYYGCIKLNRQQQWSWLLFKRDTNVTGTTDLAIAHVNGSYAAWLEQTEYQQSVTSNDGVVLDLRSGRSYAIDDGALIKNLVLGVAGRSAWIDYSFFANPNAPDQLRAYDSRGERLIAKADDIYGDELSLTGLTLSWGDDDSGDIHHIRLH